MECRKDETSVTFTMRLDSAEAASAEEAGSAPHPGPAPQHGGPAPVQAPQAQVEALRPAEQPSPQAPVKAPGQTAGQPPVQAPAQHHVQASAEPCAMPAAPAKGPALKTILLADNPDVAVQIQNVLARFGFRARPARAASDLYNLHETDPADMLILQGRSADPKLAGTLNAVKNACRMRRLPMPTILAVTADQSTWHELARAGFTHALTLPLDEEALAGTVREALQTLAEETSGGTAAPAAKAPAESGGAVPDLFGAATAKDQSPLPRDNGPLSLDLDFGQPVKKKL